MEFPTTLHTKLFWKSLILCKYVASANQFNNKNVISNIMMLIYSVWLNLNAFLIFNWLTPFSPFDRHESANGYYRCSSFFISKVICDVIPLRLIPILLFASVSYFLVGFQATVNHFFIFVLTLFLISLAGASVCLLVSSSFANFAVANLFVSLPFVLMMVSFIEIVVKFSFPILFLCQLLERLSTVPAADSHPDYFGI